MKSINLVLLAIGLFAGGPRSSAGQLAPSIVQQAYLKASNAGANDGFGWAAAISRDTMVITAAHESSGATGVNGNQNENTASHSGAAYVFVRSGTNWVQQAYLKASNTEAADVFGWSAAISGDTIVVGAPGEDSAATGVNGDQTNNSLAQPGEDGAGAAYVFVRQGTNWTQQAYLKASNTGFDGFGAGVVISGDTIAVAAPGESSDASGMNGDQDNDRALYSGAVYLFVRNGTNWTQQAYVKASNSRANDLFGSSMALSENTLVIGAIGESSNASGVNGNQTNNTATNSGAAYVFVREGTNWSQQAYLKASNTGAGDLFGVWSGISGNTLAIAAPHEDSNSIGVNGNQSNDSATDSGAVYVFARSGTEWIQQAYVKSSNTAAGDNFGETFDMRDDILVIGAEGEDSNANGIDGLQSNNSVTDSGAAYLFTRAGTNWSQQAYLKASNTGAGDAFGIVVAMSGDSLLITGPFEDSNATGVNGNQDNNSANNSGAAYIFTGLESLAGGITRPVWAPPGKIVAWGGNDHGELNVPPGDDFVMIDAGQGYHCLALRADGSLAGWGWNYGEPAFGKENVFYGQAVVPTGSDFKAVAAGAFHSLALKTDGSVIAWGANVGDPSRSIDPVNQATVPNGLSNVIAIAAGDFHSLALKSDGSLVAWGDNSAGQTDVPTGNDYVAIAAGDFHNVALKADGSLVVWGEDDPNVGQVRNAPSGNGFVSFDAGWGQTLALKTNGSMVGWGWNFNGQATPRAGTNFVAVAAGWRHSLALKSDGSLVAWGWNYGDDMSTYYGQATVPAGNSNFVAISAGFNYNLAIQVQSPALHVVRAGNNIVLTWPSDDSGFTLQSTTNLSSGFNWSDVLDVPTIAGKQYTLTNSVATGNTFYRLKRR